MPKEPVAEFTDTVATAAVMAIQLNDPVYWVNVSFPGIPPPSAKQSSTGDSRASDVATPRIRSGVVARYPDWLASKKVISSTDTGVISHLEGLAARAPSLPISRKIPPPHYRAIPSASIAMLASKVGDPPANKPVFSHGMWPIASMGGNVTGNLPPIPTTKPPHDLVVSIQLPPPERTVGNFFLSKLQVAIPYGPRDNSANRTNLFENYRGIGSVMLNNLRFNVQTEYSSDINGPLMLLNIVPRRVSGSVSIQLINEMSVLLPQVEVNDYTKPGLSVQCTMTEWYTFQRDGFHSTLTVYLDVTGR